MSRGLKVEHASLTGGLGCEAHMAYKRLAGSKWDKPYTVLWAVFIKLKILQIIMWNIGMAQKAKETRSGCLVHIVQ